MKALLLSDLHTEMASSWRLPESVPHYDILLAAGDVAGSPKASIELLANHPAFRDRPIVFVAGNHEFYDGILESRIEEGQRAAAAAGVHYLDASAVVIDGVRIVGATLWSDFELYGRAELSMAAAATGMTDHASIKRRACNPWHKGKFRFEPQNARWHHVRHRMFLESVLATPFDGPSVVVTHHAPSVRSLPHERSHRELDPAYASDLETVIRRWQPALWVHGHIHASVDYRIGRTAIRSNPKGYEKYPNPDFDAACIVDIPAPPLRKGLLPKKPPNSAQRPDFSAQRPDIDIDEVEHDRFLFR